MGTPAVHFANAFSARTVLIEQEIQWLVFPAGELGLALERPLDAARIPNHREFAAGDGKVRNVRRSSGGCALQ